MENEINKHNKKEYPPMHSAEHILNRTMVNMFGCPRSKNAHIERKKSKCDYELKNAPTEEEVKAIEDKVNEVIKQNLSVCVDFINRNEAKNLVDLSKLPEHASETLRIVKIGDYDVCACAGDHVENTSEIDKFKIISSDFSIEEGADFGRWRVRFKLIKE